MIGAAPLTRLAWADDAPSKAAAKARLEKGAELLVNHAYTNALAEFEDAYRLFPSPKIFFDIGLADVGLNRNPDALRAFQRFLVETPDASAETVARAKAQIKALLPLVAIVDIVCPVAGREIFVDNRPIGRSPLGAPIYLDPGPHGLGSRSGESAPLTATTFTVTGGTRITVAVPIAEPGASPPPPLLAVTPPPESTPANLVEARGSSEPPASERPLYSRPWFWAAAAGVVAAVTVTLLLTVGRSTSDPTASLGRMDLPGAP